MPRIPSVSDVRAVSPAVARDPGLRASAEDFGLSVAQGIAGVGSGIVEAAPQIQRLIENIDKADAAEEMVQTGNHKSKVRDLSTQMVDELGYDGGSPLASAKRAEEDLSRVEEDMLKALPPARRVPARQATAAIRLGHGLRAAQHQQNQKVAALEQGTAETLALLQSQAVTDPAAAEMLTAEGLELLRQLHEAGALSDRQLTQQGAAFRQELYSGMLRSQSAVDVVADLEAGHYDEQLGDPALKERLLNESRWRLQVELAQDQASGAELVAREARGEAALPALSAATRAILAAGDFADIELEAEKARRVGEAVESLRFAPAAAFDAEIEKLRPDDDALDKPARLEIQEAVRRGSERLLAERQADPAGYMMGQPALAKLFAAATQDPALLPAALASRLAAQAALGIAPESQRLLSQAEVDEILAGYQVLPKEARLEAIMALRDRYGDDSGQLATELEAAGLPPLASYILDPSSGVVSIGRLAGEAAPAEAEPLGGIIQEAAERLLAEHSQRPAPPLPQRKPTDSSVASNGPATLERNFVDTPPVPRRKPGGGLHLSTEKLLKQHRPLLEESYERLIDGLDAAVVESIEAHVEKAADAAGAGAALEDLARRFAAQNIREGFPFDDALTLALDQAGIEDPNNEGEGDRLLEDSDPSKRMRPPFENDRTSDTGAAAPDFATQGATRKLDEDLTTLGIALTLRGDIARAEEAIAVRKIIHRLMNIRQAVAAGDLRAEEILRRDIEALASTEQRFLVGQLEAKLNRAFSRPETVPWALTDAEVYSVYRSLGGSVAVLGVGAAASAAFEKAAPPAAIVTALFALPAIQQSSLRGVYEAELYRRGIFKRPKAEHSRQ